MSNLKAVLVCTCSWLETSPPSYIPAKHENNLYRSLQRAATAGALFRKALNHLFNFCFTQKVFQDMNFSSSLTYVVFLYTQNITPLCAFFSGLYMCTFLPPFKPIPKCFRSLCFLKVEGNDGIRGVFWVLWIIQPTSICECPVGTWCSAYLPVHLLAQALLAAL